MFKWFQRKKPSYTPSLTQPGTDYKDLPGGSGPSVDDVRFEALEFEKMVKTYLESRTGEWPNEPLEKLVSKRLSRFPMHPELPELWPNFVKEAKALKDLRNQIVHSDCANLPALPELHDRFRKANSLLRPLRIIGSSARDRFSAMEWRGDHLHFKIDAAPLALSEIDIHNFLSELHPSSRGGVHFLKGRLVRSRMLDYRYERHTYFIEGYEPFELTEEESMALQDLLMCCLGNPALRH